MYCTNDDYIIALQRKFMYPRLGERKLEQHEIGCALSPHQDVTGVGRKILARKVQKLIQAQVSGLQRDVSAFAMNIPPYSSLASDAVTLERYFSW